MLSKIRQRQTLHVLCNQDRPGRFMWIWANAGRRFLILYCIQCAFILNTLCTGRQRDSISERGTTVTAPPAQPPLPLYCPVPTATQQIHCYKCKAICCSLTSQDYGLSFVWKVKNSMALIHLPYSLINTSMRNLKKGELRKSRKRVAMSGGHKMLIKRYKCPVIR